MKLDVGTQIAYVPYHSAGDLDHPDVEFGFVTGISKDGSAHFCRYWSKHAPGELRTKATSELTPNEYLVEHISTGQSFVDVQLEYLGYIEKQ